MPYKTVKQNCTRSDGKKGKYILKYKPKSKTKKKKDSQGYVKAGCHTSKKNADGQRAAIEAGKTVDGIILVGNDLKIMESDFRNIIRKCLLEELDIDLVKGLMSHADPQELETAIGEFVGGEDKDPEDTADDLTDMLQSNPEAIEAALEDEDSPIMDIFKNVASEDEDLMAAFQDKLGIKQPDGTDGTTSTTKTESLFRLTRSQIRELIREALSEESEDEDEEEKDLDEREYGSVSVGNASGPGDGSTSFYRTRGGSNPRTW